jgi:hypothetical protein
VRWSLAPILFALGVGALAPMASAESDAQGDVPDPHLDIVPFGMRLNETHIRPYLGVHGTIQSANHYICQARAALDGAHQIRQVYEVRLHAGQFTATYHRTEPSGSDGSGRTTSKTIAAGGVVEGGQLVNWSVPRVDDYHLGVRRNGEGGWSPKCLASKNDPEPLVWGTVGELDCNRFNDTDCTDWGWVREVRTRAPTTTTTPPNGSNNNGSNGDDNPDAEGRSADVALPLILTALAAAFVLRRQR